MNRNPYPTDLTDAQWHQLHQFLPNIKGGHTRNRLRGRPRKHDLREILNALRYQLGNGCTWRDLPSDLPPWETVYAHLRRWRLNGTLENLSQVLYDRSHA